MARCLVFPFFFLALALFSSRTAESRTLYDLWQIIWTHNLLPEAAINTDHLPRGGAGEVTATPNIIEETEDDDEVAGSASGKRVDFGTKAWPYVYYARRDRKGTVDWGTKSWPYIYYSMRDGKGHNEAEPDDSTARAFSGTDVKPVTVHPGRKGGSEFGV